MIANESTTNVMASQIAQAGGASAALGQQAPAQASGQVVGVSQVVGGQGTGVAPVVNQLEQNKILISDEDAELLKFIEQTKPKIYVVGAGGSGCNTQNRMREVGIDGVKFIAMNTDVQHLVKMRADKKILLGKTVTKGMGAGSNPKIGEKAAEESKEEIKAALSDATMVFIACGMGGGTGTGSAHIIAEAAKQAGALTIAVVTLPFKSEGRTRMENAIEGLNKLRKHADTVIVIPNDKLLLIAPDLPLNTAFKVCDEVLTGSVKGIAELVTKAGLVNLDYADLRTILSSAGCAVVGIGESTIEAKPDQRALVAIETALNSPLLDVDTTSADRALINVVGGDDMTLKEAEFIVSEVSKRISPASHIIWGARIEKNMQKSSLRVLVVLAGAKFPQYKVEEPGKPVTVEDLDLDLIN
ncbi:cell division protein FtsZ [Candidatus Parvarchaeota archaeon]|nr:cell division protein FtsZ [Candidatus Parvarchaeota archaeon]